MKEKLKTGEVMVQQTATLHEKAVQAVARGETPVKVRKPRRSAPRHSDGPPAEVTVTRVHPDVWKRAQEIIADGSYTDIEIIDERTVVVR